MKHGKSISFKKPHRAITISAMAAAVAIILFEVMPLSNPVMVESIMEPQEQKTVFSSPILSEEEIVSTKIDDEHIIGNTYITFTSSLLQQQQDPLSSLPSVNNRD